jgi:hypothetical protein
LHRSPAHQKIAFQKSQEVIMALLLDVLSRKDCFGLFARAVDRVAVPSYAKVIKRPMDFGTMRRKLDQHHYHSLASFWEDTLLVSKNAIKFNAPGAAHYTAAQNLMESTLRLKDRVDNHIGVLTAEKLVSLIRDSSTPDAAYMRTRDTEEACYMYNAIQQTAAVVGHHSLVEEHGPAHRRQAAVSLKVHERYLYDALQLEKEDRHSRVFQEACAGCIRYERCVARHGAVWFTAVRVQLLFLTLQISPRWPAPSQLAPFYTRALPLQMRSLWPAQEVERTAASRTRH